MAVPNLEAINLNLLLALDVLLTELNVTRAARRLGITQSAMSHSLASLRELFDDPILVRTKSGMMPTLRAQSLAPRLRSCLASLQQVLTDTPEFDPRSAQGSFTIVTGDFLMRLLATGLSEIFTREAPSTVLRLQPLRGAELCFPVLEQEADLVVGPDLPHESGICTQFLRDVPFACAVRREHPLLEAAVEEGVLKLDAFLGASHLLISPTGRGEGRVDAALRERGLSRHVPVRVASFLAAVESVVSSDLVLTAPLTALLHGCFERSIVVLGLPFQVAPLRLCAYWDARRDNDARSLWLRRHVEQVVGSHLDC